jgi:beta-glucosidase
VPTASASQGGSPATNAIDGSEATRWTTGTPMTNGMWFELNMQSAQTFNQIAMDSNGSANDYSRGYSVYVSSDGVNWGNPIATGTGTQSLITVTFPTQTAQYIQIVQTGTASFWWSLAEINVYAP